MQRRYCLLLLIAAGLCIFGGMSQAQEDTQPARNVAFVDGGPLDTASTTNVGHDGVTRLEQLFIDLGADTRTIQLDEPISPDVEIVVIIRPKRRLSASQTAYLWDFLERGGHLLMALDPNRHNRVNTEQARNSGISHLLEREYGISLVDDFLIESWFTVTSLADVVTSWSVAQPEAIVSHPITEPLVKYDLPLRFWGARSLMVDALTGAADTTALIYAEDPYGETTRIDFNADVPDQLTLNIGEDTQGHLLLGAVAENYATGSRVALLGDSEMLQNIYGLTYLPYNETLPRYPGNFIFTQRLIAWLMGIPEDSWPPLPVGLTWIALDGDLSDWPTGLTEATDLVFDGESSSEDLYRVWALHNDQFLYIAMETLERARSDIRVRLRFGSGEDALFILLHDSVADVLLVSPSIVSPIDDASYAVSSNIEARLPLRLVGENPVLTQVCVMGQTDEPTDCLEEAVSSTPVETIEPVPLRLGPVPSAFVREGANLRTGPGTNFALINLLPARTLLEVTGRNEEGNWLQVRNGRYEGWIATGLLVVNTGIELLPVSE